MAVSRASKSPTRDDTPYCCQVIEQQTGGGSNGTTQHDREKKHSVYSTLFHRLRHNRSKVHHMDKFSYSSMEEKRTLVRLLSSTSDERRHRGFVDVDENVTVNSAPLIVKNTKISDAKLQVHSRIQLKRKVKVRKICPLNKGRAWVLQHDSSYLILIDHHGNVMRNSVRLHKNTIRDVAVMTTDHIVVTTYKHTVKMLCPDGASSKTFVDIRPYFANGICTTVTDDILVCTYHHCRNSQVVRYGWMGNIVQFIECSPDGTALFSFPYRITSLNDGYIVVVNKKDNDHKVVCLDSNGNQFDKLEGVGNTNFVPTCIARDREDNIYVTDGINGHIYTWHANNESVTHRVDVKHHKNIRPTTVAVNHNGQIMVGCNGGKIYFLVQDQIS